MPKPGANPQRSRPGAAVVAWALMFALGGPAAAAPPAGDGGLIASPEPGWPQWRGPRRDGICDEKGLLQSWPDGGPKLLWKIAGLGHGWSSPIITGGTGPPAAIRRGGDPQLYITGDFGDELRIMAFDLDGKPKWQAVNGRAWRGSHQGARASCAYSQGRLYHMNAHGRVVCLEAETGREIWAVDTLERFKGRNITWALSECLLIDGPRVIVTPGGRDGMMAALDKKTGRTVWAGEPIEGDKAGYASPVLFEYGGLRHIVSCSSRHAFGVDADTGKLLWKQPRRTLYEVIVSVPVYHDGTVFVASPDGDRSQLLRLHVKGKEVRAEPVWSCDLNNLSGGVIFLDGRLYGGGYRKFDYWLCIDHKTGRTVYEKRDLHSGSAVWADGRLYVLSERGEMALLKPGPEGFQTHGRFRLVEGRRADVWPHPVILDGRLYLRYHDNLWCYDVRAK